MIVHALILTQAKTPWLAVQPHAASTLDTLANWASLVGLAVSIIGFVYTIRQVWKSGTAALQAVAAANAARDAMLRSDVLTEFASALASLSEIERLHRASAWIGIEERYASVRRKLLMVRASLTQISTKQETTLQSTIQQLSDMEKLVGREAAKGKHPDPAKLNAILSQEGDQLALLLADIRHQIGN